MWCIPPDADWVIGAGLFTSAVDGVGLRSMKAPGTAFDDALLGKDPQPDHMSRFVHTLDDNGGVHINSGIPNRAFVLAARAVGGTSAEGAGRIWYAALTSGLDRDFRRPCAGAGCDPTALGYCPRLPCARTFGCQRFLTSRSMRSRSSRRGRLSPPLT